MPVPVVEDLLGPLRAARRSQGADADTHNSDSKRLAGDYLRLLDGGADETAAHAFLKKEPILLLNGIMGGDVSVQSVALFSKVRFSDEYVTDFALVTPDSDGARWTFVELESPQAPIFTKAGNPSHQLTHGLRQTDDWARFIKNDLAHARRRLGELQKSAGILGYTDILRVPTFIVVIGREAQLTPDTRARKAEMNDGHPRRQIVTYDRLNPTRWAETPAFVSDDNDFERRKQALEWLDDQRPGDAFVKAIKAAISKRQRAGD